MRRPGCEWLIVVAALAAAACRGDEPAGVRAGEGTEPGGSGSDPSDVANPESGNVPRSGADGGGGSTTMTPTTPDGGSDSSGAIDCFPDGDADGFPGPGATVKGSAGVCPPRTVAKASPLDCDDAEPNAYPGSTEYHPRATARGSWDFDCDGRIAVALYNPIGGSVYPLSYVKDQSEGESFCRTVPVNACRSTPMPDAVFVDRVPSEPDCGRVQYVKGVWGYCQLDDATQSCHGIPATGNTAVNDVHCK